MTVSLGDITMRLTSPHSLRPHNAADEQTGALGDIEICLIDDDVVTIYEMKTAASLSTISIERFKNLPRLKQKSTTTFL